MLSRAGILFLLVTFLFVLAVMILARMFRGGSLWALLRRIVKDHVKGDDGVGISAGNEVQALDGIDEFFEESKGEDGALPPATEDNQEKRNLRRSVLTKLKIIVAAWQIASSAGEIFRQVQFPPMFEKLTGIFGWLGFAVFDVGSFKCLFGWTYFDKLLFVTLAPFVVVLLGASSYWMIQCYRGKLETPEGRSKATAQIKYAALLFIFVVLPSISAYVITYFSCAQCRNQV